MRTTERLHVANRNEWRAWLRNNHDAKREVWLMYYRKHTGKTGISYDDTVEEALCFGWIDSIVKKIDNEKFARKFTPRKNKSRWSEVNKKRARKMIKEGKMTEAGLTKIREAKKSGEWFKSPLDREELVIPSYIEEAFAVNEKARRYFDSLANTHKRHFIGWITSAKREKTRKRRLEEAIRLLEQNKKLGMK